MPNGSPIIVQISFRRNVKVKFVTFHIRVSHRTNATHNIGSQSSLKRSNSSQIMVLMLPARQMAGLVAPLKRRERMFRLDCMPSKSSEFGQCPGRKLAFRSAIRLPPLRTSLCCLTVFEPCAGETHSKSRQSSLRKPISSRLTIDIAEPEFSALRNQSRNYVRATIQWR